MSGLNNDDDEALDNVDSLISMIKGNKKNEEARNRKDTDLLKHHQRMTESASRIGDFDALRKKWTHQKQRNLLPSPGSHQSRPHSDRQHHRMMILSFLMRMICRKNPSIRPDATKAPCRT